MMGPIVDGKAIPEFSNLYPTSFVLAGIEFDSVEQFVQLTKCDQDRDKEMILNFSNPSMCARFGKRVTQRKDWEEIKIKVLRVGVCLKFEQNPLLFEKLLATGESRLAFREEDSHIEEILTELRSRGRDT